MKKFSFSLQTVLDFKNQYLDEVKNEYSAAQADVNAQQAVISSLEDEYSIANAEYNEKKSMGIDVYDMMHYDAYLKKLTKDIEKEIIVLRKLEEILEERLEVMIKAKQEVTSLDKLREKRLDAYNYAVQKQEELFIEEFVSNKTATK